MALMELVFVGEIVIMDNKDIENCITTFRKDLDSMQRTVDILIYDSQHRRDNGVELLKKCEHIERWSRQLFHCSIGFGFGLTLWLVNLVIQMLK